MVLESDMKNKDLIKDLNARAVSTRGPSCARQNNSDPLIGR